MTSLLIAVCLAASPGGTAAPKLAAPGLTVVNQDEKLGPFYTEHLAQDLTFLGVRVITPSEIGALIGLERQRQLLGCAESACMAELAGALGVDGVLLGGVAKLGRVYQIDLKVVATGDGHVLAAWSGQADADEKVIDAFRMGAERLAKDLSATLSRGTTSAGVAADANGASQMAGANGANQMAGSNGANPMAGANGANQMAGANGANQMTGANGNQTTGANGANQLAGANGANQTAGANGANQTAGANGANQTAGANGANQTTGADGANQMAGANGANQTAGANGANQIAGANGANQGTGSTGANQMSSAGGATQMTGATGASLTTGGSGANDLAGATGSNQTAGASGSNVPAGVVGMDATSGAASTSSSLASGGVSASAPHSLSRLAWIPAVVGVGAAAAGGYFVSVAADRHTRLTSASATPLSVGDAQRLGSEGQSAQLGGWAGIGVGAAALAAGGAMYFGLFDGKSSTQVAIVPSPGGAELGIAGAFP